ncbi:flagellar hook-associated protein FlgL [Saccharibacillus brassicae]|uniref:Flagellar hook-associated protein FlgL n=1 Tax=Saccharibacillus brassicae TaxID=2583377 RepID=A0A4Y6UXV7_SACBS|nr:flagellar hook-associated protein FlgL [Saccharibacillus brassicae]QDH20855.1 flagellar hook-associated protein FlgL [Saccharibacillus brassicae]
MRVTSGMMSNHLLNNLNRTASKMNDTQLQMTTGMKINKPSDDPTGITYSLRYRQELSSNEQYQRNTDSALSWLGFNDDVLTEVNSVMQRVRELTVQASTGTNSQESHNSIQAEIKQLKEQMIDVGNSQFNGKYIFNGETYDQKPYGFAKVNGVSDTSAARSLVLDQGQVKYTVGAGVQMSINTSGNTVFGGDEADNMFAIFNNLEAALDNGDLKAIGAQLDMIDSRTNKFAVVHAEVGAKTNRLELMENRLGNLETNLTELQSKTEDADYAKLMIKSKIEESVYNASLSVGAKIISTSLVDFMR